MCEGAIRIGRWLPHRAAKVETVFVRRTFRRSGGIWTLLIANIFALGAIAWITWHKEPSGFFRVAPAAFADLPGWTTSDPRSALAAFRRSCAAIEKLPEHQAMGGAGYAGAAGRWVPACKAIPLAPLSAERARAYFETWFAPLAIVEGRDALFTGYYEPELSGSLGRDARHRVPIYGRPDDLVTAELGEFRRTLAGQSISGRLSGDKLVPYPSRASIDASGLSRMPILLYTDDPVSAFFLQIQGSGRVRLAGGERLRLAYAGTNGRPYTPIGRVLIARGALERQNVSLQTIRAWLKAHRSAAREIMEKDQSFVFFRLAPVGDPSLGSPGAEGVLLTPGTSLAVDPRLHPLGAPVFVAATAPDPDPAKPDHNFNRLLIAQDAGGAIRGPVRGDVFWGFGTSAEAVAGRMKSSGRLFVFVPKSVAAAIAPYKEFPDLQQ